MVTIVRFFQSGATGAAPATDPWQGLCATANRWLVDARLPVRETIVLLPFASLLPLARRAFAARSGWMPRVETTETLAASLGPALPAGDAPSFDVTLDRLVAARLLRSRREGEAWERRDPRGYERAVRSVVATAHALLRAASAVPPASREAHWAAARQTLAPASGPGSLERFLARVALEWAIAAPAPATDRLFDLRPAAWIVVRAGGAEALAESVVSAGGRPSLIVDTDPDDAAPFGFADPLAPPTLALCDSFEHEAQATAAQVSEHLRHGEVPVALIAQDRVLVRRVRALLEREGVSVLDETGWRLSTTRAAALVMNLLRAARSDASSDALLDWLKALPRRDGRFAASLEAFEQLLRRKALASCAAVARHFAEATDDSRERRFWAAASEVRSALAGAGRRSLADWLAALGRALVACECFDVLEADDAGRQVVAALRLAGGAAVEGPWHTTTSTLSGFTDWVDSVLEQESFRPTVDAGAAAQVVVTPLARAMLRPFAATVLPGADDKHLGTPSPPDTLLGDAQARALGVPDAAGRRRDELLAFAQLLRTPRLTLLRRRADGGEPLADSPLVARLALALAQFGSRLGDWHDPRIEQRVRPTPMRATAPVSAASLLPARLSATACDALRTCPYRFFALNLLHLGEANELDDDVEKRDYGNWLHRVLHAFHLDRGEPADAAFESRRLLGLAEASRRHFGLAEADFVPFLASFETLAPRYVAWLHGRDAAGWRWAAGEREVVIEPDGFDGISLRGIVDRIDVCEREGRSVTELIDYKTGAAAALRDKVRQPLEDTQLAFYAALLAEASPIQAMYLALDGSKGIEAIAHPEPAESATALLAGLADDLRRIRGGAGLAALGAGEGLRALRGAGRVPARRLVAGGRGRGLNRPAYQVDGRPVERSAFYAAACEPSRSAVVEACAGAGKTWMLVSRMLRALLDGAKPQEILAITFTRKAAGEMRERLNGWLAEFGSPATPHAKRVQALVERGLSAADAERRAPDLRALHGQILAAGRPVEIRTFHAWFSQLLRAAPFELLNELGLQPDMELVESLDDHLPDIFRRFHAALLRDPSLLREHGTLVRERGRSQVRKWLQAALEQRVELELADAAGVLDDSVPPADDADRHAHPADALARAPWPAALRELALSLGRGGAKAQDAATGLVVAIGSGEPQRAFDHAWSALFTKDGNPRKQLGAHPTLAAVQAELEALARRVRQHDAHREHRSMVALSRLLLAEFAAYKQSRGLADMQDLERCGLALLRDASLAGWVQERLDTRIRHLLIDEFQDTSPLQWHALLAWLSGYAGAGGGASGQRPPGVFIVGDPKQSIYRFRRAEPRVFAAAQRFVVDALDGRLLACDHTRRNAPEVLAALNAVFVPAGEAGEYAGFRPHTTEVGAVPGAAVRSLPRVPRPPKTDSEPPDRVWRDTLAVPRHVDDEVLREREAAAVGAAVRSLIDDEGFAACDIMVLCRKRESLRLAAEALRRLHLPYAAVEDFELMVAPEARDLVALLDVLASTQHRLSLAQVLRSPLFGASDDDLVGLARSAVHGDWWRSLLATPQASAALQRAAELLREWHADVPRLPPHDLLDRIVHTGGLRERVAATVPPERRAAALEAIDAVLEQALTLDGARYATPYGFVRALKRRLIRVAAPGRADAVQLLTVHGAKGLEARAVFVMDTDPEPKPPETAGLLVEWPVDAAAPRRCAFLYAESACPPALEPALAEEREARRREELNGLYVAMSRARERLVFSATEPFRASGAAWWDRAGALAEPWVPAPVAAPPAPGPVAEVVLRTIVPLQQPPAPRPPPAGAAETDATRLGKAVHRLLEWSTQALEPDLAAMAAAAAAEQGAPPDAVLRIGRAVLASPDCARFFSGPALGWAGNEVPVGEAGEALRIDRLVRLDDGLVPVWWVLDYKLGHAPEQLAGYRDQLLRYRRIVEQAQSGATVRCAFITGSGEVIEIG